VRNLPQRLLESAVVLLAAYALVSVPIGRKTGLEHLKAIFTSGPALEALSDLKATAESVVHPGKPQEPAVAPPERAGRGKRASGATGERGERGGEREEEGWAKRERRRRRGEP
jgi:hypothetical protein